MRNVCCPKCGKMFVCRHDSTCFCTRYRLSKKNAALLRENFHDCLCEECLKRYAEEPPQPLSDHKPNQP